MRSVNKVILLGIVGQNPEVRFTPSGTAVATFSLATNAKAKQKDGSYAEKTTWHNCVAFGKTAEIVQQYVFKGTKTYLEGEIDISEYDDKGSTKKSFKIIVREISFLSTTGDTQRPVVEHEAFANDPLDGIPF